MLYYISINGREFPLTAGSNALAGRPRFTGSSGDLDVQLLSHPDRGPALVVVDGAVFRVQSTARPKHASAAGRAEPRSFVINGQPVSVTVETELARRARPNRNKVAASIHRVIAPMPGRVVKVNVRPGDVVAVGAPLLGIEAMKMENELLAPTAGKVARVTVQVGSTVEADQELVVIDPS